MDGGACLPHSLAECPEQRVGAAIGWQKRGMDIETAQARDIQDAARNIEGEAGDAQNVRLIGGKYGKRFGIGHALDFP